MIENRGTEKGEYLFDTGEAELKSIIDPCQDFIPPHKVGTVHHSYIRSHFFPLSIHSRFKSNGNIKHSSSLLQTLSIYSFQAWSINFKNPQSHSTVKINKAPTTRPHPEWKAKTFEETGTGWELSTLKRGWFTAGKRSVFQFLIPRTINGEEGMEGRNRKMYGLRWGERIQDGEGMATIAVPEDTGFPL